MNKTALKNFATSARNELIKKVEARALKIGITEESIKKESIKKAQFESSDAIYIDGKRLSITEKKQRDKLIQRIREIGFKNVMEEVAYTWFNRFIALRFMEVNNYLPTKVRVLSSSEPGNPEPDIIKEALSVDLDIDKELVYDLKLNNKTEELFKYMVIKQCNDLNKYLPFMFETIEDYKEILFPDSLLSPDSFVRQVTNVEVIPGNEWEQIEIIGWLYQYYNTELNELVYDGSMSKSKVSKELLPAATQLFTPDWAVQYMVENSLGCLWLEAYPDSDLKSGWKYHLDKTVQRSEVGSSISKRQNLNPEDIKVLDPCMGSGHILVYAFEILMQIYQSCGYVQRDAAKLILEKNLYGLEIDDRAYQLACFAVMMKARKYNRRIFNETVKLNLCSIAESNELSDFRVQFQDLRFNDTDMATLDYLISAFHDANEYGAILDVEERDYDSLDRSLSDAENFRADDLFKLGTMNRMNDIMPYLSKQARIMSQKYDVVVTNPPYLGSGRMSSKLNEYVKKNYPESKSDLSIVMYQKALDSYSKHEGFVSFITTTSWMYLKGFETFRKKLLQTVQFESLVDFGTELFEGKVGHNPIVSWTIRKSSSRDNMVAVRLVDFCYSKRDQKQIQYFNLTNRYQLNQMDFLKIPGHPFAYWVNRYLLSIFSNNQTVADKFEVRNGITTGENDRFIRNWFEVCLCDRSKWFPCNKGGPYRKWYGNREYVIDWENDGQRLKTFVDANGKKRATLRGIDFNFKHGITMSRVTSSVASYRWLSEGFITESGANNIYAKSTTANVDALNLLGLLNSKVGEHIMEIYNPTINIMPDDLLNFPLQLGSNDFSELVKRNIEISKIDWDSYETSWDFQLHPLIRWNSGNGSIRDAFEKWKDITEQQFLVLKDNEETINRVCIELYGLQDKLSPIVDDKDVTVRKADLTRDVKSFISYAVGCMFGRYSLDDEGLVFAGGNFTLDRYKTFVADVDNVLPILTDLYFGDDIVVRFVEFLKVTFGEETIAENLEFIAEVLGKKDSETSREAIQRYFLNDYFKDHVQVYKKKPIYWLFTSGKHKAFNCLIYMHRYDKTTLSRIRTDYVHELQMRLEAEKKSLLSVIEGGGTSREVSVAKKDLKTLELKIEELNEYEEILHHMADMQIEIDLDDGVSRNYTEFGRLLATVN